ncbi:cytochrome p450 [Ophiostoma piceae UAMH 11346]|uniref:Cytochrome p450 n=1 Tax=Ophiostoma piceae (strain UAMH 11346) TaxID=1262450 RepID=S3BXZ7_OPHP1|nr:cytochrome p450 [Ophiostoma piceae UAMH 11346]
MLLAYCFGLLAAGQASAGAASARHRAAKRSTETVQLYAYGTGITASSIYVGLDNLAYIVSDDALTNMTGLTWTIDTTGTDAWTVQANTTTTTNATSTLTSGSTFYVVTSEDAFEQAGFVSSASDAPTGAVTTGFVTYGSYVMLLEEDATSSHQLYVSEFWATNSSVSGVWALMWNEAGTTQDNSVPVTLRIKAPVTD